MRSPDTPTEPETHAAAPEPVQITLGDIRAVATRLRANADRIDQVWASHNNDSRMFSTRSSAASDASHQDYRQLVDDILSYSNLQVVGALDHADQLARWGEGAASGDPTPVWAPWSVARSLVELCAASHWLTAVPLSTHARAGRMLTISKRDALSMIRLRYDESARVEETEATARRLQLREITDRRGRFLGFGEAMPSITEQVEAVLPGLEDLRVYSMLSAASHGEPWAISLLGYEAEAQRDDGNTYVAAKRPSAFWLWSALTVSTIALLRASSDAAYYRGWSLDAAPNPPPVVGTAVAGPRRARSQTHGA